VSATLEETLSLGACMEALRREPSNPDEHFDAIITLLWAHDPSAMPDRTRLTLRNMGLEDEFDRYVMEHDRELPPNVAYGGPVRWVIAPEGL
jgi:hypothetical protein